LGCDPKQPDSKTEQMTNTTGCTGLSPSLEPQSRET
jgi:hypothetical protein